MTPELTTALGGLTKLDQWFVWRLEWDAAQGKYLKTPCAHDGSVFRIDASKPDAWASYERVVDVVVLLNHRTPGTQVRYALGLWLTADSGYWFFDIDMVKLGLGEGVTSPYVDALVAAYPGAFVEWSSSSKGMHVIGRLAGVAPPHRSKPPRDVRTALGMLDLEFYTEGRGIAFGLSGFASGCTDVVFDVAPLVQQFFPPREQRGDGEGARGEWRGPADDDVLIERMLGARLSAEAAFGGKASLPQLWRGECERDSGSDMALACHLAFWTGCDEDRMERLMLRSGLKRDKWFEHRTYLRELTIANACQQCETVYQEPERNLAVRGELYAVPASEGSEAVLVADAPIGISSEVFAKVESLLSAISACGDEQTMINTIVPSCASAGVPRILQERVVNAVKRKLKFWDNGISLPQLRALLFPPPLRVADPAGLPEWAHSYCFVANGDKFYNTNNDQCMTMVGFQAVYGRYMPITDQGRRENAAEKCLHFWNLPVVEQIGYRPDQPSFYEWNGVSYANRCSPSSLPAVAPFTERGVAGMNEFQRMMFDMCGRRQDVFLQLMYWFAHNVQQPGRKIRWAPIIKGVHGDGKTLLFAVLRAAMGYRNVATTSNSNISNSGGFTDWAVRGAVNVIEEIMLTGKPRHQLYNAMKEFISNNIVDVNPKGATPYQTWNATNHAATTNHNDGLPMEPTDRRWFVVFTPWGTLAEMMRYCGVDAAGWKARTDAIDWAKENCAGELRAWFLGMEIPDTFDINGSAMMTPEKKRMMASSTDDADSVIADIIGDANVISSLYLSRQLKWRANNENFDVPKTTALNHAITRLGYSKVDGQVKVNGHPHTIWLKNGVEATNDQIREVLATANPLPTNSLLPPTH